jgi:hypothetical protein
MMRASIVGFLCVSAQIGCSRGDANSAHKGPWKAVEMWRLAGMAASPQRLAWVDPTHRGVVQVITTPSPRIGHFPIGRPVSDSQAGRFRLKGIDEVGGVGRVSRSLWIFDRRWQRIGIFSQGGFFQHLVATPAGTPLPRDSGRIGVALRSKSPLAFYADSSRLAAVDGPQPRVSEQGGFESREPSALVRVSATGVIERVIAMVPPDNGPLVYRRWPRGLGIQARIPFVMRPIVTVSAAGSRILVIEPAADSVDAGPVVVHMLDANGDTVFRASPPIRRVPVEPHVVDSALTYARTVLAQPAHEPYWPLRAAFDTLTIPRPVYEPVVGAYVTDDGLTWLRLGPNPSVNGAELLALDEHGRIVRSVVLPSAGHIYCATLDDLWVGERVGRTLDIVRYSIQPDEYGARDSAGVRVVLHRDLGDAPPAKRIAEKPIAEIGGLSSDSVYELSAFRTAVRLRDGSMVVPQRSELRLFDSVGRYVKTVGRRGAGPGEFSTNPLWIFDDRLQLGRIVPELRAVMGVLGDGTVITRTRTQPTSVEPPPTLPGRRGGPPVAMHVLRDGQYNYTRMSTSAPPVALELWHSVDDPAPPPPTSFTVVPPGVTYTPPPRTFRTERSLVVHGEHLVIADGRRYKIEIRTRGKLTTVIRVAREPSFITENDRRRYSAFIVGNTSGIEREFREQVAAQTTLPAAAPVIQRVVVDDAGRIWVPDFRPPWVDRASWTVFDLKGELIDRVEATRAMELVSARQGVGLFRAWSLDGYALPMLLAHRLPVR